MEWRVLPEDAPVIKATPGKRLEDMISGLRKRVDDTLKEG